MNIDNETVYYATCDWCGAYSDDNDEGAYSAEEAEAEARHAGWTVLDTEDGRAQTLCPQCQADALREQRALALDEEVSTEATE